VLGAGTDYGLFLVFRVREELRTRSHDEAGSHHPGTTRLGRSVLRDLARPREAALDAIVFSVTKVGESIAASAGTVIVAMFTLLLASFPFYGDLGLPFAIAIAVTLLAAMTLLPALLSIRLSLLAVKRSLSKAMFGRPKLVPFSIQGKGGAGLWGRIAGRIVLHPLATLLAGVVMFGGLSFGVLGYVSGGFGGDTAPPAGSDSAAGQTLMQKHFPQSSADVARLHLRHTGLAGSGAGRRGHAGAVVRPALHPGHRPAQPGGQAARRGRLHPAARRARPGREAHAGAAGQRHRDAARVPAVPRHR